MRAKTLFMVLLLILCSSLNQVYAQKTLKMRVTEWPPHYYRDKDGNWTGLDVALAKALITTAGFKVEFVERPWSRALLELKQGHIHLMANLELRPDRSEFLYFIGPEHPQVMILVLKNKNRHLQISSLDDMVTVCHQQNKSFGYQQDVFYSQEFELKMKTEADFNACFENVTKAELNLRKTRLDRILGFFDLAFSLAYRIKNDQDYRELTLHPFIIAKTHAFFGVSKKGVETRDVVKLYEAYETLVADQTLVKIKRQWENKVFSGEFNPWKLNQ